MNKKSIILPIADLVISAGVSAVCHGIIDEALPEQDNTFKKVAVVVGSWAISHYVSSKVTRHCVKELDTKIDEIDQTVTELKDAWSGYKKCKNQVYVEVVKDGLH